MKTTNNNQNIESKNRVKNYDGEVYVKNCPTIGNVMRVKDGLVCIIFKQGGNGWYQAEDVNELPEWAVLRADIRNRETGKKAIITHIYHNYAKGRYEVKEEDQEYAKYIDVWDLADLYEPEPEQESDKANDLDEIHRQFTKGEREAEDALVRDFHGKLTKKGGTTKLTDLDTACFFAHIITAVCHEGKTMQEAYESACKDLDYMSEWRGRNLDRKVWDCLITERAFRRIEKQVSGTITWNVSYRYTENHWFAIDYTANDGETGVLVIGAETEQEAVSLAYKRHKWIAEVTGTCLAEWDGRRYHRISTTTDPDGGRKATLKQASEITDIPAADLVWDEDKEGVKVWGNIESHRDNLERMGGRRGRVVFTNNKTGLPTGADCYTFRKDREADIREYVSKTHDRISRDFSETRDKHGERGHEYHEGERVVTVYGRGTVVKTDCWHATDLIDVRLDAPTYNYIWSLAGTPQRRVAVNRDNIVSIELPEPPKEVTLEEPSEITAEPTLYERHNITADERRKRAEGSAQYIRRQARLAREAFYHHKGARIETSIAYRNGQDDPDKMSYKVSWYDETRTGELHLVDCENGISLGQAARHMADFALLTECGLTLREILYPAA